MQTVEGGFIHFFLHQIRYYLLNRSYMYLFSRVLQNKVKNGLEKNLVTHRPAKYFFLVILCSPICTVVCEMLSLKQVDKEVHLMKLSRH